MTAPGSRVLVRESRSPPVCAAGSPNRKSDVATLHGVPSYRVGCLVMYGWAAHPRGHPGPRFLPRRRVSRHSSTGLSNTCGPKETCPKAQVAVQIRACVVDVCTFWLVVPGGSEALLLNYQESLHQNLF